MYHHLILVTILFNICVAKICNVLDFGAIGDGVTDDTKSIQKAMDSCSSRENEESIIQLPSSYTFYTYPIRFNKNNLHLWIDTNSTLFAATNWTNGKWPYNETTSRYVHIIQNDPSKQLSNISIYGQGLINGNGPIWWVVENSTNNGGIRPYTIVFQYCHNVSIYDISVINSPAWNIYIYKNIHVVIHDIDLRSPPILETDGIDVGSTDVHIYNCYVSTGDDSYALKDGAKNVLIENSTSQIDTYPSWSIACACAGTGSEQPNPVEIHNCTIRNIICNSTAGAAGLKVKIREKQYDDQYGDMSFITFQNITLINVDYGISINDFNQTIDVNNDTVYDYGYVSYHDIQFIDIVGTFSQWMGHLDCAQQTPCYNLSFININMKATNKDVEDWVCSANVYGTAVNVTPPLTCLNNK